MSVASIPFPSPFSPATPPANGPDKRVIGWDLLRAVAAMAVVLLHACVPYSRFGMPGLAWCTRDNASASPIVTGGISVAMWTIEIFIMPLFLAMAGYLAMASMARRGTLVTVRSRCLRLGVPLIVAIVLILPMDLYVWLIGWLADGVIEPTKLRSLKLEGGIDQHLYGLSHLWFLPYLITYIGLLGCLCQRSAFRQNFKCNGLFITLILTAASMLLWLRPEVVWGFQHAWLPVPAKWAYSGLFFILGVSICQQPAAFQFLSNRHGQLFAVAIMLMMASIVLGMHQITHASNTTIGLSESERSLALLTGRWGFHPTGVARMSLAVMTATTALLWTIVMLGVFAVRQKPPSAITTKIADASLWIYLLHHPVVALSQVSLKHAWPTGPVLLKVLLVCCAGVVIPVLVHRCSARRRHRTSRQESESRPGELRVFGSRECLPTGSAPHRKAS